MFIIFLASESYLHPWFSLLLFHMNYVLIVSTSIALTAFFFSDRDLKGPKYPDGKLPRISCR